MSGREARILRAPISRDADDPWGAATVATVTHDTTQLRWKGLLYEGGVTGLYYMRARWYDPITRRFISPDPLGLSAGINQYAFAGGDPINGSDPSGMDVCDPESSPGGCAGGDIPAGTVWPGATFTCTAGDAASAANCWQAAQLFMDNYNAVPTAANDSVDGNAGNNQNGTSVDSGIAAIPPWKQLAAAACWALAIYMDPPAGGPPNKPDNGAIPEELDGGSRKRCYIIICRGGEQAWPSSQATPSSPSAVPAAVGATGAAAIWLYLAGAFAL
jgi:RHS repeat-associated protein